MNLFTTDKSPAILAIFVAVIGFYISTVAEQIRSQATVTYDVQNLSGGRMMLRLENVSREKIVNKAAFEFSCNPITSDCFTRMPTKDGAERLYILNRSQPVSPSDVVVSKSGFALKITATMVPGAVITLQVKRSDQAIKREIPIEFYYTPDVNEPEAVLLLDRNSLTAQFVASYLEIMILAFLLASAGLAIIVLLPGILRLIDIPAYDAKNEGE